MKNSSSCDQDTDDDGREKKNDASAHVNLLLCGIVLRLLVSTPGP
jgi:hypothetical protein